MTEKRTYAAAKARKTAVTGEIFASGMKDALIRKRLVSIVDQEAPITEELLKKRLINSFDLCRAGSGISAHLEKIIQNLEGTGDLRSRTETGVKVFFVTDRQDFFRTHTGRAQDERYSYQTPPCEAAACIRYIRENGGEGLGGEALLERFKHEFGWKKAGARVSVLFENALSLL